jgi:hypothetical protein
MAFLDSLEISFSSSGKNSVILDLDITIPSGALYTIDIISPLGATLTPAGAQAIVSGLNPGNNYSIQLQLTYTSTELLYNFTAIDAIGDYVDW